MHTETDKSLKNYNTFGIDVKARKFISVESVEELKELLKNAYSSELFILGGGSNMLLTRDIEKTVVHVDLKGVRILSETEDEVRVQAMAGENWHQFVLFCIDNGFGGVIFHEACGHSLEATSVAKNASVFSGKKGEKIGSNLVTAIDDGTIPNAWGSANYDDEGLPQKRRVLIDKGVLTSYMVDQLNGKRMNEASTHSSRRQSYRFAPTSRMSNTYIDNGESTFDEIIENTDYGLYARKMGGGSVNPSTGDFNFSVMEGYMIRNGKIAEPVKGATLVGTGKDALKKIDMVGNNLLRSQGMCGSVSGAIAADVGQPTIRIASITVGGRKEDAS